jgi:chromosome partitioning protein
MPKLKAKRQIRVCVASNAGGSGKTTSSVHLAFGLAKAGYTVTIIELDLSGSMATFTGLDLHPEESQSLAAVFSPKFRGDYPLKEVWPTKVMGITAIQGGEPLRVGLREINRSARGVYLLKDRLEDYPLEADVVILDTPASLETMAPIGLAASTHILSPIKPETKDVEGFAVFVRWFNEQMSELRLKPEPEFLGFLPMRVKLDAAMHRNVLGITEKGVLRTDMARAETLPGVIESMGIRCFPPIRESMFYVNASYHRLPLGLFRPNSESAKDFDPVIQAVIFELTRD